MFAVILALVLGSAPTPTPSSTISPLPPTVVQWYAAQGAAASGLDAALVRAVIDAESGGDPRAVSSAGAVGMMQLEPATAGDCGIHDRFDPLANVECGSKTLGYLVRRYGIEEGLESYNFGAGNVAAADGHFSKVPQSTQSYVKGVILEYDELQHVALSEAAPVIDRSRTATASSPGDALAFLWLPLDKQSASACGVDALEDASWQSFGYAAADAVATFRITNSESASEELAREETD